MDASFDVFLTCLPRDVTENVIRNLFKSAGNVTKVKIIDDKKNENNKLSFVGFGSMDEAMEAVRLADKSTAFGDPIKACISKKSLEGYDGNAQQRQPRQPNFSNNIDSQSIRPSIDYKKNQNGSPNAKMNDFHSNSYQNNDNNSSPSNNTSATATKFSNVGRGRGMQIKREASIPAPSFQSKPVNLTDIKLKSKELIVVEIVDLSNLEVICARPLKHTENSKVEIIDLLVKINNQVDILRAVDTHIIGDCYLGKWDDNMYYRAELLEVLRDGTFRVTFVDEGTTGDIVSDIKHIPEGPLQQYPKQFTKISLGCKDGDDLRNFIINESDGKKVSLFWLGDLHNGIPLINLFLNEEEIVEKFIQLNKNQVRDSFSLKFKDLPNHKAETDCTKVTFLQSLYKSQGDFTVQLREPCVIAQCHKKCPPVLPVPGDICIYERRNGVNNVTYLRCVVKRRQLFSFDILLFDSGENLNNVSIDCLFAAEESHISSPPFTIICELDKTKFYSEDQFQKIINDENLKFSIVNYKGNNKYLVEAVVIKKTVSHYPETDLHKLIGHSNKVIVTHVISPLNFFVQVDKPEFVQTLNDIHEKLNINYNGARFTSLEALKPGQAVVAPFSVDGGGVGENFRATIVDKRPQSPQVHVFYIDYGNDGWVDYKQLLDVGEDIVSRAGLAVNCTLNVDINKEAWNHAIELFSKLVGFTDNDDCSELVMQSMSELDGKLTVDLMSMVKGSISMALDKSGTCFMKNDTKSGVAAKPLCNGDVKKVSKVESQAGAAAVCGPNSINSGVGGDYGALLRRVDELEQRLAQLEKRAPLPR